MLTKRQYGVALLGLIFATQVLVHIIWARVNYQGAIEFHAGEAFEAYHGAQNVETFGLRWAALQDMATAPSLRAHPYLYVHHPNFGLYFSLLAHYLGFRTFASQMALSTAFWSFGIVVFCLLVDAICGDRLLALVSAGLVGLDPGNALEFGCNIHRAADFGSACLFLVVSLSALRSRGWRFVLLAIGTMLFAMGADYIHFFFLTLMALMVTFAASFRSKSSKQMPPISLETPVAPVSRRQPFRRLVNILYTPFLIATIAFCAFSLRQIQVISGAGYVTWTHDFLYQVLNRTHNERLYHGDWSKDTTDFYADSSILNPGFAPKNTVATRFAVIGSTLDTNIAAFFVGRLPMERISNSKSRVLSLLVPIFSLTLLLLSWTRRRQRVRIPLGRSTDEKPLVLPLIILCSAIFSLIGMSFLIPTYFTQWFPAFRLPLFLGALLGAVLARIAFLGKCRPVILATLILLLLIRVVCPAEALQEASNLALDHAVFASTLRNGVTYCNFTSASVSCFSGATTCVPTAKGFVKLGANGHLDSSTDFQFLLEKDRFENKEYMLPHTVILFPYGDPIARSSMEASQFFRKVAETQRFVAFEHK